MEEKEKVRIIIIQLLAEKNIREIKDYIVEEGYPENAEKFILRMASYIQSIYVFPFVHSECRNKKFNKRNWRCAVFENNYIIAYKIFKFKIVMHAVINVSRLK